MAKMTISGLATFAASYVAAAKQAGAWSATTDNLYDLIDKIGMQITLDGSFIDKLRFKRDPIPENEEDQKEEDPEQMKGPLSFRSFYSQLKKIIK